MATQERISGGGLLEAATVVVLASVSVLLVYGMSRVQSLGIDFAPVWAAAADPANAFDAERMTEAQRPFIDGLRDLRPFAYAPPALLLFTPLGLLPFWPGYILFAAVGVMLFLVAVRQAQVPWWAAVSAPVVLLVIIGQTTLIVCGLLLAGFLATDWRSRAVLIGVAGVIKPQLCLFVPLLLIFNRDWRTFIGAAVIVAALSILATAAFGPKVWSEWLASTRVLVEVVQSRPEFSEKMLQTHPLLLPLGIAAVWRLRNAGAPDQLAATAGAALLVAPYAMTYELAVLVPSIVNAAALNRTMLLPALALGVLYPLGTPVVILSLVALVTVSRPRSPPPEAN
jgi:hypothetical protein